jgi:hypothetical protein
MKIILPLSVIIPRKTKADKVFILNLNTYRNTHHFTLNAAKTLWKDVVATAIAKTEKDFAVGNLLRFSYTIYPSSNRKFDVSNVCSIIDKFTCDALIEFGVIPDDSYKVISQIIYCIGSVDKENPRCELEIIETEKLKNVRSL